eukprot:4063062-Lingulodinium_polyedra.AAC.1
MAQYPSETASSCRQIPGSPLCRDLAKRASPRLASSPGQGTGAQWRVCVRVRARVFDVVMRL